MYSFAIVSYVRVCQAVFVRAVVRYCSERCEVVLVCIYFFLFIIFLWV